MKWQALPLVLALGWSCRKDQSAPPPATVRPALTPAQLDTIRRDSIYAVEETRRSDSIAAGNAHRDSVAFMALADSMSVLETSMKSTSDPAGGALILLRLGQLKERANSWMIMDAAGRSAGVDYAKSHGNEYSYFDPDARYYYNGRQWRALLTRFPQSSLADSARWYLAHMERGHGD